MSEPEALITAAISLGLVSMWLALVERPIRRISLVVRRPVLGLAGGGALAAAPAAAVMLAGTVLAGPSPPANAAPTARTARHKLTSERLHADLIAGARTTRVPSNLDPPLNAARSAKPQIVTNGCSLQYVQVRSKPCVYGDKNSNTTVAVFGDSHAAVWFPALAVISNQRHWRLVDLTKAGCPPPEVNIEFFGKHVRYGACAKWRRNTLALIAALHPALVVVSWARFLAPEARPLAGVPTGYGSTWLDGVAATFSFLRRATGYVIFISDVPSLGHQAPACVARHISDVRPCTAARDAAIVFPDLKTKELDLAKREHIRSIDPTSWFCAPTRCPVIVGHILLYRDSNHMVPAWSRFIAPVLADSILPFMRTGNS